MLENQNTFIYITECGCLEKCFPNQRPFLLLFIGFQLLFPRDRYRWTLQWHEEKGHEELRLRDDRQPRDRS